MDPYQLLLVLLLFANVVAILWFFLRGRRAGTDDRDDAIKLSLAELKAELVSLQMQGIVSMRESLDTATGLLNDRLSDTTATLDRRMGLFGEIEQKLGELSIQSKNMERIGLNIQSLSDLLKPPKLRGGLGEMFLENLLAQILPKALYSMQYQFENGQRVDAVIRIAGQLMPIDSKFPMESFQRLQGNADDSAKKEFVRTLKKHIDVIADKYIRPAENSTDIALMYIPSEAVYYHFVADDSSDGLEYALSKRVIPTSPGHLYGFLASIAALYKQVGLSGDNRRIVAGLNNLVELLTRLNKHHGRMEGALRTLTGGLSRAREESIKMADQVEQIREPETDLESKSITGTNTSQT